jgi:hypothetical protein
MKKMLFSFDVRLKDLLHLGDMAKTFSKLEALFKALDLWWYDLSNEDKSEQRRNNIRIGSVNVLLDDDGALHLDFCTRFSLKNEPLAVQYLEQIDELRGDEDNNGAYFEIKK